MATEATDHALAAPDVVRPRAARGEGDRLRGDLLDAAADLMAEHGSVEGISLRAVARRAGVSPTAVYRHFDDHMSLLRAAVDHCWSNFSEAMVDAFGSGVDPYDAIHRAGEAYIDFALRNPGQYRVIFSNRIALEGGKGDVGQSTFDLLVAGVDAVIAARGDGRDPRFVAAQVHTWIHGIVDLVGCHPAMDWPDTDLLLDGLGDALGLGPIDA